MVVGSFEELQQHAKQLVDRINTAHNGGARFLAHPLRMLKDLDIELSPRAMNELLKLEPALADGSDIAYEALLRADTESSVQIRLTQSLFRPVSKYI